MRHKLRGKKVEGAAEELKYANRALPSWGSVLALAFNLIKNSNFRG